MAWTIYNNLESAPDIELVGHNLVYRGLITVPVETIQDDQLYEHMAALWRSDIRVVRDGRIREVLGEQQMDSHGD
jgi:hypothetical protein